MPNETLKFILEKTKADPNGVLPIPLHMSRFNGFPKLFGALGLKTGAEIGVASGFFSQFLFKYIPDLKLYCVDPWTTYPEYVEHQKPEEQIVQDAQFNTAKERLAGRNAEFVRKMSMDAVKDFADGSLDFVYIDGNHSFEYVIDDISAWSKKVRVGGIVAGHDYWNSWGSKLTYVRGLNPDEQRKLCQVKDAVDGWTMANCIRPWFIVTKDKCPSWFWVRE